MNNGNTAKFKLILIVFLSVIAITTITYNYYLLNNLRVKERSSIELWAKAIEHNGSQQHQQTRFDIKILNREIMESLVLPQKEKSRWNRLLQRMDADLANAALDFVATEIIIKNRFEVPSLVADSLQNILYTRNIDHISDSLKLIKSFSALNKPIKIRVGNDENFSYQYVYYGESQTVRLLRYFPFIQLFLLGIFLSLAYYSWSVVRQSEQSNLWVGMAKEAAHQLGTPLSSLFGWLTLLESDELTKEQRQEIIFELGKDTERMQKVADRFNKIGSSPELKEQRIEPIITQVLDYLEPRIPRLNKGVVLKRDISPANKLPLNAELFEWAIENVVKNAIDAIVPDQSGSYVKVTSYQLEKNLIILVEDSGKGIEKKNMSMIFKPGFSTKKRGWGLGLSLTKRIVEEYHKGKIELVKSELNAGTVFQITLPVH